MAPSNALMVHMEEKLLPKEKNKLRKPVVEKMRRDRINSSIEQLKLLLEKEFQRHQPNSKLEKADILEMTVSYLKQQSQLQDQKTFIHKSPEQDFNSGYLRCLKEAMHFLSYYEPKKETQPREPRIGFTALELLLEKGFQRISEAPAQLRAGERRNPGGMAVSDPGQGRALAAPAQSLQRDDPDGICSSQGLRNAGEAELPLLELTGGTWGLWSFLLTHLQPPAKPAAPKRFRSLRRHWEFRIP
ncbi:hypothetical protein HGM15179_009621 [Zosterops borbonicus]|uniref:Transcription factor HES-5 n=1 Tax=Zosterops borbonicus TaxID=364589 RepID=A0A8K1LKN4_9PASS|nr:hypothetical protein HGM15179_009621 [Zosterops borbonicus]